MIDFRYHVVSTVAVFLALALGLVIGSTSLRGTAAGGGTTRTSAVTGETRQLRGQLSDANGSLRHATAFDAALAPYAVSGRLTGQSVVIVAAPGAEDGMRRALTSMLTTAGATVTGDVGLRAPLLDPRQDAFLTTLTSRLHSSGAATVQGSGAERAVSLLADVLGTRPGARPVPSSTAESVLSAFTDGRLLSVGGGTLRPASLAVLLAAPPPTNADPQAARAANTVLLDLARDLDRDAVGAAVVGPAVAAADGGLLQAARADRTFTQAVSTVDDGGLPSGQIATVFALSEQLHGRSGSYGTAAGAGGPLPGPTPSG